MTVPGICSERSQGTGQGAQQHACLAAVEGSVGLFSPSMYWVQRNQPSTSQKFLAVILRLFSVGWCYTVFFLSSTKNVLHLYLRLFQQSTLYRITHCCMKRGVSKEWTESNSRNNENAFICPSSHFPLDREVNLCYHHGMNRLFPFTVVLTLHSAKAWHYSHNAAFL